MSRRIHPSWVVLASIESAQADRCVDVFRRPDDSFGFEEFRRDVEDRGAWTPVRYFSAQPYATQDAALAASMGRSAGSDIFIHGQGPEGRAQSKLKQDWTAGCVAVTDAEAEEIYSMVQDGTPILITP